MKQIDEDDGSDSQLFNNEDSELERYLRNANGKLRARTAPIKPMSDIEEFKRSNGF